MYQCVATSAIGFVQQIAVSYLTAGHWFYVRGWVPEGKSPEALDQKLVGRYGIGVPRWERSRRKKAGAASVHYIRCGRLFVLLATHGRHSFFEEEGKSIRDARKAPLRVFGYAISHRGGHSHVRIEMNEYKRLRAFLEASAVYRSKEELERYIWGLPFEPYAPVRRQVLNLHRLVNRLRRQAGFDPLDVKCVRTKRRIVKPFAAQG